MDGGRSPYNLRPRQALSGQLTDQAVLLPAALLPAASSPAALSPAAEVLLNDTEENIIHERHIEPSEIHAILEQTAFARPTVPLSSTPMGERNSGSLQDLKEVARV